MSQDLPVPLPCPFCGTQPRDIGHVRWIVCANKDCGASGGEGGPLGDYALAVKKWNARACMAPLQERADALQEKFNCADLMAQCMAGLREDCIKAGVVDESVPPMMYPDEIIPRLLRADALEEALKSFIALDDDASISRYSYKWSDAINGARSLINPTGGES